MRSCMTKRWRNFQRKSVEAPAGIGTSPMPTSRIGPGGPEPRSGATLRRPHPGTTARQKPSSEGAPALLLWEGGGLAGIQEVFSRIDGGRALLPCHHDGPTKGASNHQGSQGPDSREDGPYRSMDGPEQEVRRQGSCPGQRQVQAGQLGYEQRRRLREGRDPAAGIQ